MKTTITIVFTTAFLMSCAASQTKIQPPKTEGSQPPKPDTGVSKTEPVESPEKVAPSINAQDLTGDWQGIIKEGNKEYRVIFNIIEKPDKGLNATLFSLDEGGGFWTADSVFFTESNLKITWDEDSYIYEGKVSPDGTSLQGTWSDKAYPQPEQLNLNRATKESAWLTPLDAVKRKEVVEDMANKLTSSYAIAEIGSKMAAEISAKLQSKAYNTVTSPIAFAIILQEDLFNVAHDKHLQVKFSQIPLPTPSSDEPPHEKMIEHFRRMNGYIPKVEILDGNIGYMRINGVPPFEASKDAVSAAFAFVQNTDALILDNRGNGGGDPKTVAWYMSYLSEGRPYVVNTFHHRKGNRIEKFKTTALGKLSYGVKKPVFVLTSPHTFSGGEELAYDIQAFKRGTIVGAVTGGGANPTDTVQLVHNFLALIPFGYAVNPITKTNWEGVGVIPDVEVAPEQALKEAHLLAVNQLINDEKDPQRRHSLEAVAQKLKSEKSAARGSKHNQTGT